ncbi:MAG: GGDEF domain-containing protein [Sulfuricella denitrificans]|nr:GGDEF domain-containing protein [Sulfuricella denitrificans]
MIDPVSTGSVSDRIWDQVPIGIVVLDAECRVQHWNGWLAQKTAIGEKDAQGKTLSELFPNFRSPRLQWAVEQAITHLSPQVLSQALNQFVIPIHTRFSGRHGTSMMQQHVHVAPLTGRDGRIQAVVSIMDVTESITRSSALIEVAQKLQHDSNRDALTGLYNRRFMWEWLVQQLKLCNRHAHPLGCLLLDIDHFKMINDTYGHDEGDQVLRSFAQVAQDRLRDSDILVRYGGEEFAALLPHCSPQDAIDAAQAILQTVRKAAFGALPAGKVTCSIGVSWWTVGHPVTGEELLKCADKRLYEAKQGGRDRVVPGALSTV